MTSPLVILERSFRRFAVPAHVPRAQPVLCGVYLLTDGDQIVYCGSSIDVIARAWTHRVESRSRGGWALRKQFDGALWYPLPRAVFKHYEGAFIRFLDPRHNLGKAPGCVEHDDEIIDGFGLDSALRPNPNDLAAHRHRRFLREQRLAGREDIN